MGQPGKRVAGKNRRREKYGNRDAVIVDPKIERNAKGRGVRRDNYDGGPGREQHEQVESLNRRDGKTDQCQAKNVPVGARGHQTEREINLLSRSHDRELSVMRAPLTNNPGRDDQSRRGTNRDQPSDAGDYLSAFLLRRSHDIGDDQRRQENGYSRVDEWHRGAGCDRWSDRSE